MAQAPPLHLNIINRVNFGQEKKGWTVFLFLLFLFYLLFQKHHFLFWIIFSTFFSTLHSNQILQIITFQWSDCSDFDSMKWNPWRGTNQASGEFEAWLCDTRSQPIEILIWEVKTLMLFMPETGTNNKLNPILGLLIW